MRHCRAPVPDLIGDDPAIHPLRKILCEEGWMRGSSPRMTRLLGRWFWVPAGACHRAGDSRTRAPGRRWRVIPPVRMLADATVFCGMQNVAAATTAVIPAKCGDPVITDVCVTLRRRCVPGHPVVPDQVGDRRRAMTTVACAARLRAEEREPDHAQ